MTPVTFITAADPSPARVVIAGGGVAALEALLALRSTAPAHVEVHLVSPQDTFSYAALSVAEPFGLAERHPIDVRALVREQNAVFHQDALESVDPKRRTVHLRSGARLAYDALLLAMGTRGEPVLPGALTFGGPVDAAAFRLLLGEIETGAVSKVAFAAARGARWPLPLYELALMTSAWAARRGVENLQLSLVTYEDRPLEVFGERIADRLRKLLADAHVDLHTRTTAVAVQPSGIITTGGRLIAADRVIALPRLRVNPIPGIPQSTGGFIPTDEYAHVEGLEDVYAAGDATWYPIKQGGLAAQQADVAAASIAAAAGADVEPFAFSPVLRGVLLTGAAPQYLRGEGRRSSGPSGSPLWLPVTKVAGRYLGPYLAERGVNGETHPLVDLPERRSGGHEHGAALELALDAADAAAGWGDTAGALRWLDVAEGLNITLPPEYALKREQWREVSRSGESAAPAA